MFSHHSESTLKTFGLFQTYYPRMTETHPPNPIHTSLAWFETV